MPIYNVEQYLPECIDSIIHQTYRDIDIILVDDGSTDSSGEICDEYARLDPRISVIHKTNGGLSDARNAGLSQSHTKYIYFLDSDDYIEPQAIEILHAVSEQYNLDVLVFDVNEIVNESSSYVEGYDYWIASGSYPDVMSGAALFTAMFNNKNYKSPVQVYFYNREFLSENGLTFMKGIIHEDEHFTLNVLLRAKRAMHIPVRLYDRRIHSDSIMTVPKTQRNYSCLYEIFLDILSRHNHFRNDPETKAAYDIGIERIMRAYLFNYFAADGFKTEEGRMQFEDMMRKLEGLGYNPHSIYRYRRRVKLRHLYSIKTAVEENFFMISFLARAKRVIRRVVPKLDDELREILARLHDTNKPGVNRIITLCVPRHGNRGDIAISLAQRKLFTEKCPGHVLIELPGDMCANYPGLIIKNLNEHDILITNGGGYFGSLWRNEELAELGILRHFPGNRIIIMPQTWYYSDDKKGRKELASDRKAFSRFTDLHVFARDRNSFSLIHRENIYPNAKSVNHVPDMVLSMDFTNLAPEKSSGVLVCLRPDPEKVMSNRVQNDIYANLLRNFAHVGFFTTNPAHSPVRIHDWEDAFNELLRKVASAELVVTDRLHGMIFAAITGTPCVAFDNKTGKVHSVHEWISGCEYVQVCGHGDDFGAAVKRALEAAHEWDNSELIPYFSKITALITEKE